VDCSDPFYNELDTPNKTSYSALHEPHTLQKPHLGLSTSLLSLFSHPSPKTINSLKRVFIEAIDSCALLLMNNSQHFVGRNYPRALIEAGINQLWLPSAYAGTCGEYTSGLIQKWLNSPE